MSIWVYATFFQFPEDGELKLKDIAEFVNENTKVELFGVQKNLKVCL